MLAHFHNLPVAFLLITLSDTVFLFLLHNWF